MDEETNWKNPFMSLINDFIAGPGEQPLLDFIGISGMTQDHYAPDYTQLPLDEYLSPGFILPYSGANGCYWRKCTFCPETAEDNPYIPVPYEKLINDLSVLIAKTKPSLIHLLDNAINPKLLRKMIEILPVFHGWLRKNRERTSQVRLSRELRDSGCVMLKLGLESGDQGII